MSTRQRGVKHSITKRRTPGRDWEVRLRRVAGPRRVRSRPVTLSSQVVTGVTGVHPPRCNGSSTWLKTHGRVRANRSALRRTENAPPTAPVRPCPVTCGRPPATPPAPAGRLSARRNSGRRIPVTAASTGAARNAPPGRAAGAGRARGASRDGGYASSTPRARPGHSGAAGAGPPRGARVPRGGGGRSAVAVGVPLGHAPSSAPPGGGVRAAVSGRFGPVREPWPGRRAPVRRNGAWVRRVLGTARARSERGRRGAVLLGRVLGKTLPGHSGPAHRPSVVPRGATGTAVRPPEPGFPPEPVLLPSAVPFP